MALNNPRDFITNVKWELCDFELMDGTSASRTNGGAVPRLVTSVPYWRATWTSVPLNRDDVRRVRSWFRSMVGGAFPFYGYDVGRRHPSQYVNGNGWGVFTGDADVFALTETVISVENALANMDLRAGDLVNIRQGTNDHLHEIAEDVTLSGLGAGDLTVFPTVITNVFDASATVHFLAPRSRFIMEPRSWSGTPSMDLNPVSFSAIQEVPQ